MKSGHCAGVGFVVLLVAVLAMVGVQVGFAFGQPNGSVVSDACEPAAADMDFNGDEWIDFADFARLAQRWQAADFNDLSVLVKYWLQDAGRPIYITWLGHASVKVAWTDQTIYVDPYQLTDSPHDATLLLVTHSHSDHYSPADITKIKSAQTQFIGPADVVKSYGSGQVIAPGQTLQVGALAITGVAMYNITTSNHPKSNNWVGFIVQIGRRRIYFAGDTDLTPEMKALTDIDVAFLPAGGTYTMAAAEAAEATKYLKPTLAIPYHWGTIVGTKADADKFVALAACNAKAMTKGETISSDDWSKDFSIAAYWKLDETAGDIARDSNGSNHATLLNGPTWQPAAGKVGGALELDGVDDYVSTPFVLNPSAGSFSVFAWVKGGAPGQVILSQQGGVNWLAAAADGALATEFKGSGRTGKPLKSAVVITDGEWHRTGLTWDGTGRVLYVDGVQVAKDTQAGIASSTAGLNIGAGGTLAPGTFWSGLIDDVCIYARVVKP
jgi:L-ascorbate metabolism protein UlaG (beta-lactamase superfamily)